MCVPDVEKQCTLQRRSSVEAIPGTRVAFDVPSAGKDWSPQQLQIETAKSTVKVVMRRTLVPRALVLVKGQGLWPMPSEA